MMTPDELRQSLRSLGITQEDFGDLLFSARRTVVYWTAQSVPGPVEVLVRLLERRPELVDVLRDIAAEQGRAANDRRS